MIKAAFFDLDGVLTEHPKGSYTMSKNICDTKPGLAIEDVLQSFRKDMGLLTSGQCSLRSVVERVCAEFSIPFSEEFLIDVARKTPWNMPVIKIARAVRSSCKTGIITDNSRERMEILWREPELSGFDPIIVSAIEKASKSDGSTTIYDTALQRAGCAAAEAVFIDNQKRNLVVPASMGMNIYFHDDATNDTVALRTALKQLGIELKDD